MAGGGRELAAGDSAERGRRAAQRCGRLTAETLHGRVGRATWGWDVAVDGGESSADDGDDDEDDDDDEGGGGRRGRVRGRVEDGRRRLGLVVL